MSESRKGSMMAGEKPVDLDYVLVNEIGQFGKYQALTMLLVSVPLIISATMMEYVFSAAAIPHRCKVPECGENGATAPYNVEWTLSAIPETSNGNIASCERFAPIYSNGSLDYCPEYLFDADNTLECDGYVYDRTNSVVYDFDLGCQEFWRAFAGTLNSIGALLVLPITGYISDKYGRRMALVFNVFNIAFFGLMRAFSVNFFMYMALQLIQPTFGAGSFSSAYIFAAELVGPKYRVITSATCSSMFAFGQVILAGVAWLVQPWRYMIMAIHIPVFLVLSYYWILDESIRWLLARERFDEAKVLLEKVARVNGKEISEKSMIGLMNPVKVESVVVDTDKPSLVKAVMSSSVLLRRVCTTPIWWIATTFVYYGLNINSTSLSDTMYLNYMLTVGIEIPGFYTAVLILDRIGRKLTLSSGFFLSAGCNLAFAFMPNDLATLRLIMFLLGKFGISVVFTSLYLYTSELYPTEYRHTLLAFSSMVGRIGAIVAPLTPVLNEFWDGLPSLLFASMGVVAGVLVLTQPETMGTRMPNTLAEAELLGSPESKQQNKSSHNGLSSRM